MLLCVTGYTEANTSTQAVSKFKLHNFLNHILSVLHFEWLLVCAISVDEKMIGFKGRHMDKMRISYKNKGGGFQAGALCD